MIGLRAATERHHAHLAFALLVVLGALVLFVRLGNGPFHVYDEGLYGMYGRTMLHYDEWLHVVDAKGEYPVGKVKFSKPPMSVWLVAASFKALGPSLLALRLPFAFATFLTTLLLFAFGRLLDTGRRGVWLGFAWGACWLLSSGVYQYGRAATIEALLTFFVMCALYAYARALQATAISRVGWASAAGCAVAGAFMTKQLVCALAVLPIVLVELRRLRVDRVSVLAARVLPALGIPVLCAAAWIFMLYAKVGRAALDVLWKHAIVARVAGFDGRHHQNYLNRVASLLQEDIAPFSLELAILGLGLVIATQLGERRSGARAAALVALSLASSWLAFDVGTRAILPWYILSFLPPLALGYAWLITRAVDSALFEPQDDQLRRLAAGVGAAALVFSASLAARDLLPSLFVAALGTAAVLYCLHAHARARWIATLLAGVAVLLLLATFERDAYHERDRDASALLGERLHARGATHVSIDPRAKLHGYHRITFFGATAEQGPAPWRQRDAQKTRFDARVEAAVAPRELVPPGMELIRAAGMFAVVGDLRRAPFDPETLDRALARGPLTFEAEDMASGRAATYALDPQASGGALRRVAPRWRQRAADFELMRGSSIDLPKGKYLAEFWVRLGCRGVDNEVLGSVRLSARGATDANASLRCGAASKNASDFTAVSLPLTLRSAAPMGFALLYRQGHVEIDRVVLTRKREPKRELPAAERSRAE